MFDQMFNPLHGCDATHYRGGGEPNTGQGAAHYIFPPEFKVDDGIILENPMAITGDFLYCTPELRHAGSRLIRGHLDRFLFLYIYKQSLCTWAH
jgi:hypothetical protein